MVEHERHRVGGDPRTDLEVERHDLERGPAGHIRGERPPLPAEATEADDGQGHEREPEPRRAGGERERDDEHGGEGEMRREQLDQGDRPGVGADDEAGRDQDEDDDDVGRGEGADGARQAGAGAHRGVQEVRCIVSGTRERHAR